MIEVKNLTKRYGEVEAVKNVSFSVGKDQVMGFLGPNGAGKTTIMKILTGFHFPSDGRALIDGIQVDENPVQIKKLIGYMPENVPLYVDLTVTEYLNFISQARLTPKETRKDLIEASIESCGLSAYRNRKIDTLSKGYRQRTGLAQAILHDPPILILDEPTNGLDPNQIIEIRSLIKGLGKRKTVILSTHILQEVEAICSQVLIINEGQIAAQGTPKEIAKTLKGGDTWELILKGSNAESIKEQIYQLDNNITSVSSKQIDNEIVSLGFYIPADIMQGASGISAGERIFDWAVNKGLKILSMDCKKLSLEEIFVKLTSDTTNEEAEQ